MFYNIKANPGLFFQHTWIIIGSSLMLADSAKFVN